MAPPPKLTISEWADRFRKLSSEASAEPGQWFTARAEYQRGMMDAISATDVAKVVMKTSAQVGKTEILNNALGFYIDLDPSPILVLQPTLDMAEVWSKDRLAPMLRDTPALHGKVADVRSRDTGNTMLHKRFVGGHLTAVGANSPSGLASRPIRILLADEVDRYPVSAGTEGDPLELARKRLTTFWNAKEIVASTPTIKGLSRIDDEFEASDQRFFHVPCGHCNTEQRLVWAQVRWTDEDPETAGYACIECGVVWSDVERHSFIRRGRWVASKPFAGIAGFHLSEIYSPWRRLSQTVREFLKAKGKKDRLRVWVNTALGECWEDKGAGVEPHQLERLQSVYGPQDLPDWVQFATAGVDTQGDRLEVEIVGWGPEEESAGIGFHVLEGNPALWEVWEDLDALLLETYSTESGRIVRVQSVCVDSGGHHAEQVLDFCSSRARRRVFAIKGHHQPGRPIWPQAKSKARTGQAVYVIGTDTAKDTIYARFQIEEPGPGFPHLPADPETGYGPRWREQATAEQKVTKYRNGRPEQVWVLPNGKRNEALDCRVYAYAALKALPLRARRPGSGIQRNAAPAKPAPRPPAQQPVARKQWLGRGRGKWL